MFKNTKTKCFVSVHGLDTSIPEAGPEVVAARQECGARRRMHQVAHCVVVPCKCNHGQHMFSLQYWGAISYNYQPVRAANTIARLVGWSMSREEAELSKTSGLLFFPSFCKSWKS